MNSPALGIAYVIWLKARWVVGGMLVFIVGLGLAIRLQLFPDAVEQILCSTLLLGFAWAVLINVLIFNPADLAAKGSAYPTHMLVLPARTRALVGWPMFYGAVIHTLLWSLLAVLVLIPGGLHAPIIWPAAILAAISACIQAIAWSPFPSPFFRVPMLFLAICPIGVLAKWVIFSSESKLVSIGATGGILGWILVAYAAGVFGLAQMRAGNAWDWGPLISDFRTAFFPKRLHRSAQIDSQLCSANAAQAWYERRRNVRFLPVMVAFFGLPMLAALIVTMRDPSATGLMIGSVTVQPTVIGLGLLLFMAILFSSMAGANLGKFDLWTPESIAPFFAVRPITSVQLVLNKMKAAATSDLWGWLIILAIAIPWAILDASQWNRQPSVVRNFFAQATLKDIVGLALAIVGLLFVIWRNLVVGMWPSLTGRKWIATALGLMITGAVFSAPGIIGWIVKVPDLNQRMVTWLPWILGTVVTLKVGLAMIAGTALMQRGLMTGQEIFAASIIWLAAVLSLIGIAGYFAEWSWNLAAGMILIVPLVRIGAAPLALDWNRHR